MSENEAPVRVSRISLTKKVVEGLTRQGWSVVGIGGAWTEAMEPLIQYLERKGIEVTR